MYTHTHGCTSFITYIQQMLVFLPSFLTATVYNPLSTVNKSFTLQTNDPVAQYAHTHILIHTMHIVSIVTSSVLFFIIFVVSIHCKIPNKNNKIEIYLNEIYVIL